MFRLTVVAAPDNSKPERGSTFTMDSGETTIGRHSQNSIVLQSDNVSKKHCVLVVDNTKHVKVKDQGSSNGTYVNGKLTTEKDIRSGDRISVGEFVFEVTESKFSKPSTNTNAIQSERNGGEIVIVGDPLQSNVVPFPQKANADFLSVPQAAVAMPVMSSHSGEDEAEVMPSDPLGKIKWRIEKHIMPYFYSMNERYEWRFVCVVILGLFILANALLTVSPLIAHHEKILKQEITKRAEVIANQIAEVNTPILASKMETKAEIGFAQKATAVRLAYLLDMDNRVIAPAQKAGQYFTVGIEATYAVKAREQFLKGRETGLSGVVDDRIVMAIEPLKVYNPQLGKNQVVGMAIVSMDSSLAIPSLGEASVVYAHSLVVALMVGFVLFAILYRVTLKPLEILNNKIDKALRGESIEFKSPVFFEELDPLWNVVDSAMKRIPRSEDGVGGGSISGLSSQDLLPTLKSVAETSTEATAVLDENAHIYFMNPAFEEVTGLRLDSTAGQLLASVSRDQAFSAFVQDLFGRATPGGEALSEDFDFSGNKYKVSCFAFGSMGSVQCRMLVLSRSGG